MVATPGVNDVHGVSALGVGGPIMVNDPPIHIDEDAGDNESVVGFAFTVSFMYAIQPLISVYFMESIPAETPVTVPVVEVPEIVAILVEIDTHGFDNAAAESAVC
jgi:hypothetical protein